jgi:hypothetical protein
MSECTLDWAGARVEGSKLTVPIEGEVPRGWKKSFDKTVRLLSAGHAQWGEITYAKHEVKVADVSPGTEDTLRHHLEGLVQQANAHHRTADAPAAPGEEGAAPTVDDDSPDGQMTQRFRSFGEHPAEQ